MQRNMTPGMRSINLHTNPSFCPENFPPENPEKLKSLEIGVGTGRFASALGLDSGLNLQGLWKELQKAWH